MSLSINHEVSKSTISPKILVNGYITLVVFFQDLSGPYTNNMILITNT